MIGSVGSRAVRAVDDLERPVVLAALAGDEEHVDVLLLERADGLVDAVGHPDELEARIVGQGSLDVEDVETFDCDECADGAVHRSAYRCPCACALQELVLVIDFFGRLLGVTGRAGAGTTAFRSRTRARASGRARRRRRRIVGDAVRGGARMTRTFGASRPSTVPPSRRSRSRCRRGRRSRRSRRARVHRPTGIATARCFPRELGRDRVGEAGAEVGGRDLLAGEDVRDRDAAVEVRRVGDRADLEVVLGRASRPGRAASRR